MNDVAVNRVIPPIPDETTSEAILYGTQYKFAKSSKFYWDMVEDVLNTELAGLRRRLIDPSFCAYVLRYRRDLIFASEPAVNHPRQVQDLRTLAEIVKRGSALRDLAIRRKKNLLYAKMIGISEYSETIKDKISESEWKSATIAYDEPIDFETIRALQDGDEEKAVAAIGLFHNQMNDYRSSLQSKTKDDVERDAEGFRHSQEEFRDGFDRYCHEMGIETPEDSDDGPVTEDVEPPEIPIFREVEEFVSEPEPEPEPPELRMYSPMARLHESFIEAMADWLVESDTLSVIPIPEESKDASDDSERVEIATPRRRGLFARRAMA